jgi:hypothetical protein
LVAVAGLKSLSDPREEASVQKPTVPFPTTFLLVQKGSKKFLRFLCF